MPVLNNAKHEAFAQGVAGGEAAGAVYARVYAGAGAATAASRGPRLLKRPEVHARVAELQEAGAAGCVFTLQRTLEYLVEILETPAGAVDERHRLCQEVQESTTRTGTTVKVKMPGKLEALEKLIKLRGWYQPDKVEHAAAAGVSRAVAEALEELGIGDL